MNYLLELFVKRLIFIAMILIQCTCLAQSKSLEKNNSSHSDVPDNVTADSMYGPAMSSLPRMPIAMNWEQTASSRQLTKYVLASRLIDDMEEKANWSHYGYGEIEFTNQRAIDGEQSISLISPTLSSKPSSGRPMGTAVALRKFQHEDWREFNRLSFWVYPTHSDVKIISMGIVLKVAQDPEIDVPYKSENPHYFILKPQQWNHIIWEIPQVVRHKVEALEFHYRIQGREPGVATTARFDIDHLELQLVEPDYFEGWEVAPGRIATSHTGYEPDAKKTAISSTISEDTFRLVDTANGETVLTKQVEEVESLLGNYQLLDFSEISKPGSYIIKAKGASSFPIRIQENIWLETIRKSINFLYCERCGSKFLEFMMFVIVI